MATLEHAAGLDIMELSRRVTVTMTFHRMREWTFRVKVASLLFQFACWVLPFETEIETDDN